MPSWKDHEKYCQDKGVNIDACKFANRLIDEPEDALSALFEDEHLRKYLYNIFGFEWVYWISVEMKNYWKALSHGELHGTSKEIDVEDLKKYRELLEEIATYFYEDHGRRAVQLHFELDETDHVLKEIRQVLLNNIVGSCYVPSERRYLPASAIVSRAINSKDADYISRILIEIGRMQKSGEPLQHYRNFLVNIRRLISQKPKAVAVLGKTFEQVIEENPQLGWLKPLIEEANRSELNSGWAIYECSNCHHRVTKPEGEYYCKGCGPNFIMVKIREIKIKDLDFETSNL